MYPKEFTADVDACPQFSQERVCEISPDGQGLILRPMVSLGNLLDSESLVPFLSFACALDCNILCMDFYRYLSSPLIPLQNSAHKPIVL